MRPINFIISIYYYYVILLLLLLFSFTLQFALTTEMKAKQEQTFLHTRLCYDRKPSLTFYLAVCCVVAE